MRNGAALAVLLALAAGCGDANGENASKGGGGGGGRSSSITLAASDVGQVQRGSIDAGWPITGNLEPIDRVEVRAQIEGDLVDVYVREGERVQAGQLLARFRAVDEESNARSAEADLASARTDLSTAQWNLEQTQELYREGAVPERDQKAAEQQVAAARARVAAAQARLRASSTTLGDTRVVAPMSGTIEARLVAPGEHVNRGASLMRLVRTDVLELQAAVPTQAANQVAAGQLVRFAAGGRSFDGKVARVSPTLTQGSRTVTLYVQVPNPSGALKGGTFASGRVVSRTEPEALLVPIVAVRQSAQGGSVVWRIKGGELERVPVTLGVSDESQGVASVASGLAAGDSIVVGNAATLGNGMKVQVLGGEGRQAQN